MHDDNQWLLQNVPAYKIAEKQFVQQVELWLPKARIALATGKEIPNPLAQPYPTVTGNPQVPTSIYNAMIHRLIPYAIKGAIWYQGKSNVRYSIYYIRLRAMINVWRRLWKQGKFCFYIVQNTPYSYGNPPEHEAWIWSAEEPIVCTIHHTGIAGIMDIGMLGNIHPFDKSDVGARLSLLAFAKTHCDKGLVYSGPNYKSMNKKRSAIAIHWPPVDGEFVSRNGHPLIWFQMARITISL